MVLEELIWIFAGGQMQHPQLQLPLQGELLHFTDGADGRTNPSAVRVKVENDALAVGDAAELGDLLAAEGGT